MDVDRAIPVTSAAVGADAVGKAMAPRPLNPRHVRSRWRRRWARSWLRFRFRPVALPGGETVTWREAGAAVDRPRVVSGFHLRSPSSHPLPRISIPHLGFRYGYGSAAGSLRSGVRVCAGGCRELVAPEGVAMPPSPNRCDRARCRNPRSTRRLHRPCRFIRQMEGESCLS